MESLFPDLDATGRPVEKHLLIINQEGLYSISRPQDAQAISELINQHLDRPCHKLVVTDATANVGGNVLNFAQYFKKVYAFEKDPDNCFILKNNVKVYGFDNVIIKCTDFVKQIHRIETDIVFIDAPWGGPNYKKKKQVSLYLSNIPLSSVVNRLYRSKVQLTALKVPRNFNYNEFVRQVKYRQIFLYKLAKFHLIILIHNPILG